MFCLQCDSSMPTKPKLSKGKKVAIIAIAAAIVLLGAFAAISSIFFPRDFLIFFLGEERYTRTMFSGAAEGVSELLVNQFSEMFEDGMDMDIGELMYSISFDTEPGAVRRLANDFAFFDDDAISTLELLAASSVNFSAAYDISGQSPLLNIFASWNITGADSSTEEILSLESLVVDDSIYLRVGQLLDSYVGINLGDLGLDLSDLGGFSNVFEQYSIEPFGISPENMERLSDFIDDNEQGINAMISDVVGVFFSSFDDMRVDRNVSVSVGEDSINLHRAVITTGYEDILPALADVLRLIGDNEEYTSLIFDALWIIDSQFNYTRREFLDDLDYMIEDLEALADSYSTDDEYVDISLYINRRNRIVGFGMEHLENEDSLSLVFIDGSGYDFTFTFDDTYIRLHGFINSVRQGTMGDLYIYIRYPDLLSRDATVIEGKLLSFQHNSDTTAITVAGGDILGLVDDLLQPDAQTSDLLGNLDLSFAIRHSDSELGITLDIRLQRPEIAFTLLSSYRPLDNEHVSIIAPKSEDVIYFDLPALMAGNLFALLPHFSALMEIYSNFIDVAENLDRMGFDVGRLLENLLADFFQGLF